MPFNGLHPFLQEGEAGISYYVVCGINALQRAASISTFRKIQKKKNSIIMCQCPSTGLHHFYRKFSEDEIEQMYVSMPFNGLTSFLHAESQACNRNKRKVSMPFNGLTSFLHFENGALFFYDVCQCPSTGLHHFY